MSGVRRRLARSKTAFYVYSLRMKARLAGRNWRSLAFYLDYYTRANAWLRISPPDVTVVSYPKSGRTWLERLMVEALVPGGAEPSATLLDVMRRSQGVPRVLFSHAGSSWETRVRDEDDVLRVDTAREAKGRVILLVRDPRSIQVSAYFHMRHRTGIPWITPEDMVTHPVVGARKLARFLRVWLADVRSRGADGMIVRYEDLRRDGVEIFRALCRFAGLSVGEDEIRQAVRATDFQRMRAIEEGSDGKNPWLAPVDKSDMHSFKVRSGRRDEFREVFNTRQLERIEQIVEEELGVGDARWLLDA